MRRNAFLVFLTLALLVVTLVAIARRRAAPVASAPPSPDAEAVALVAQMTLDEKVAQAYTTSKRTIEGIARLGIPPLAITNGPAGIGPGSSHSQPRATALPAPIALAASFDPSLARAYGALQGSEARALGSRALEAPDINIARVALHGRTFEGYGEDPMLAAELAVANITGIQSQGVLAEVKHFAANNQERDRRTINELIDERTLREVYLPAFEAAVTRAKVAAVMCAYPSVNGAFMCQNQDLLTSTLRGEWGFRGFVQSDSGAVHDLVAAVRAGLDLELFQPAGRGPFAEGLKAAVLRGEVTRHELDQMITRRLATEIRWGLLGPQAPPPAFVVAAGGSTARAVADQSAVLLRNEHSVLPLDSATVRSVAVLGPLAATATTGGGGTSHVDPTYTVTPRAGLQRWLPASAIHVYSGGDRAHAAAMARHADVAIVMVGDKQTEGKDRLTLALPDKQDALVRAVAAANPRTVVVVKSGGAVLMPWRDQVPAILECWYPGQEDGNAVADLLFGQVNPSGKLPVTFPAAETEVATSTSAQYPGVGGTAVYSEKLEVGYRWYTSRSVVPLFPFGYGLSYTSFSLGNLSVSPPSQVGGSVRVTVDVTNTGTRSGAEVAQLYLGYPGASHEPPLQLRGFAKAELRPGQRTTLNFTLAPRAFSIWDITRHLWRQIHGSFAIMVGNSSARLPLRMDITR